jgi:hypothetical protein
MEIHATRWLGIQGKSSFAILGYAKLLMTQEIRSYRCVN